MKKILLASATGYLGSYILKELELNEYENRVIIRNKRKLTDYNRAKTEVIEAEVTKPETLSNICEGIDTLISTIGITNQKDGLTYMDVDYRANSNLLNEAKKSGVKKFIYVSVLNGEKLEHLKICEAKEKFVKELISSGLDYCIIRPNGFFSDMTEFYNMAKKGRIYLFGNGKLKANPIHGEDLAKLCLSCVNNDDRELKAGGPETLTQNQIAETAFKALNKTPKITYIPDWLRRFVLRLITSFTSSKTYGPVEFFMTVMAMDMVAPEYGKHTLKEYFESLNQ
jgi:uncharacterized protein YbjT (DUF2867 family)